MDDDGKEDCFHLECDHHIVLFFRLYLLVNHKDEYFVETKDIEEEISYYFHIITDDIQIHRHCVNFIFFSFLYKNNDDLEINDNDVYFCKYFDIFLDEPNDHQYYINWLQDTIHVAPKEVEKNRNHAKYFLYFLQILFNKITNLFHVDMEKK